ncbi:MAG TPA: hypothetical protein VLN47_09255 [Clostridiaceae bacterium]|nr:hypothetical protein [Clostridiaceae bacterium]
MKVLLIHNKDITMEYLEDILGSKCIQGEVIVALPDAFTLEVMRNIHFDMVIGSVQKTSIGVTEAFLGKVKGMEIGDDIYTYMAIEKETLSMLNQDFLDVVDDFISLPLDREEFGYRLAKAAKKLMKQNGVVSQTVQDGNSPVHMASDVSSPDVKILDNNLPDVSIKDILESELVERELLDPKSLFAADEDFSFIEAEIEDSEVSLESAEPVFELPVSEAVQYIDAVLEIEVHPEGSLNEIQMDAGLQFETGIEVDAAMEEESDVVPEVEEVALEVEEVETEAEELEEVEIEAEEVEIEAEEVETETVEVEMEAHELEVEIIVEPSYDELLKARELRRQKEKAEYERQEKLKWERIEEAARRVAVESTTQEAVVSAYGEQAVGTVITMGAVSHDYPPVVEDVPSYHDQVVRAATAGIVESTSGFMQEAEASVPLTEIQMEEIPCEPSYEDLVRERELRLQKEQEEARRQSMAKKFSGFNLESEGEEETVLDVPAATIAVMAEEHRTSSKAETIQEEIDLLKHLRKDYNVKTTKINTAKFKKEKKHNAEKRQKKENKSNGILLKVSRVFLFLLLVAITTVVVFYFTGRFEGGVPIVINLDSLSNLWGWLK